MTTLHFYESVFATRYKVLGVTLPPLSLWHLAALEAIDSPFVTGRGNICLGDIQMAVQVCKTRWPNRPEPRPTIWTRLQNLCRNRDERYVRLQAEILTAHIQHHSIFPDIWRDEGGNSMGSPEVLTRIVGLMQLGATLDQAWNNISPGMASWMMAAASEYNGSGIQVVSDRDKAIMEHMKKEEKRG